LVVAYCGAIFYLSSLSNPLPMLTARVWDKALHLCEYSALGVLLALACGVLDEPTAGWRSALAIILGCVYGLSDEAHQLFVPGRDAEIGDAIADTTGTALGTGATWLVAMWRARRSRRFDDGIQRNSGYNGPLREDAGRGAREE
jgi:VanZ family protein